MTIYTFGGTEASYVVAAGDENAVTFQPGAEVKAWSARTGGEQLTDLADEAAQAITVVPASDGTDGYPLGGLPIFRAPSPTIWLGQDGQPRVLAVTSDLPAMLNAVQAVAVAAQQVIESHTAESNGHETGIANLVDTVVPPPESRPSGHLLGVVDGGTFGLVPPSVAAGAVLLNPPLSAGDYIGNVATPPLSSQGQPWMRLQQPYSAADDNPDAIQYGSTTAGGGWIKTSWFNGNSEFRSAPSTVNRIAHRVFEYAEGLGGPSTGRYAEWSTNPTNAGLREPLLGGYGTSHPSKPGWVEATRVLSALLGVRAGGNYNSLTATTFRGQKTGSGAPSTGTWAAGDVVLDATGTVYLCTAAGTPGTWAGAAAPTAYTALTMGTNITQGSKQLASRLDRGGDSGRLRGFVTASAGISAGAVIATIPTTAHRPAATAITIVRYTGGGSKCDIATNGEITLGSALTNGQSVWFDGVTYDLLA